MNETEHGPTAAAAKTPRRGLRPFWLIGLVVAGLFGLLAFLALRQCGPVARPELVRLSVNGYTTNDTGQRCLEFQVRNDNPVDLRLLSELQPSPAGSGLFGKVAAFQSHTIALPAPNPGIAYEVEVSCYVKDDRLPVRAVMQFERLRGKRPHEVTRLLFVVRSGKDQNHK